MSDCPKCKQGFISAEGVCTRCGADRTHHADEATLTHIAKIERQNELYAAEMSAAKAAGFETAQDLFTAYQELQLEYKEAC